MNWIDSTKSQAGFQVFMFLSISLQKSYSAEVGSGRGGKTSQVDYGGGRVDIL